jgi:hypothetical protein
MRQVDEAMRQIDEAFDWLQSSDGSILTVLAKTILTLCVSLAASAVVVFLVAVCVISAFRG